MKSAFSALLFAACLIPAAHAEKEIPIMNDYEVLADELMNQVNVAQTREEVTAIQARNQDLIKMGFQVMAGYAGYFPECAEQYVAMEKELPGFDTTTPIKELRAKFHDAVGLPAGPKLCYLGRSMVYYPFIANIRMNGELDQNVKRQVLDHYREVIEHVEDIRKKLQ